jgi:hypothetical protein
MIVELGFWDKLVGRARVMLKLLVDFLRRVPDLGPMIKDKSMRIRALHV